MKISLSTHHYLVKFWSIALILGIVILTPSKGFSQDEPQEEQQINSGVQDVEVDRTAPVVGSDPWENSAGSTIGTRSPVDNGTGASADAPARPGVAQRPAAVDGPPDPPNPDVPFDANMNIAFLMSGLLFAFWIARKKLVDSVSKK